MVHYFIYAKDFSGSTEGVKHYHENGLKTLDQFKEDEKKIKEELLVGEEPQAEWVTLYLHWGDACWEVDEKTARDAYDDCACNWMMASDPESIIEYLKESYIADKDNKIQLLYIVTDGIIDKESVTKCVEANRDICYKRVVFHAFNEDLKKIDLSVAASFFKGSCLVYRNNELCNRSDILKEFNYDNVNCNNFAFQKHQLNNFIKLKFINRSRRDVDGLEEIDKLKKLKDQLFSELAWKTGNTGTSVVYLETKDRNVFLRKFIDTDWYNTLTAVDYADRVDIEKSITSLIKYIVSDVKSKSFEALKFDMKFYKSLGMEHVVDVDFLPVQEIELPDVILDDDERIPVVILTPFDLMDKIIFHKSRWSKQVTLSSFSNFKSIMECPLFLVNDQDLSESIGYFYGFNVYKQMLSNNTKTELRTQKSFHGGLVLTDTSNFDKYNDYILSVTYFDGKRVKYNIGLFYYVLWKNCENKEWMDRNVVEQFRKYAMRRINQTLCKIGLSSLPLNPQERTTLLTALWYCVELSSCIFKNDPQHFKQERLREYYDVAPYMMEILKWFNYDLDLDSIEKRKELVSHLMTLKKIRKRRDKVYYLLEKIFKTVDGFLVSEIEMPSNLYKLNYLKLNHKEILRDDIVEEKVHLNDYVHLMYFEDNLEESKARTGTFEIYENTFPPVFAIDQDKSFYTELVENTKKIVISNDDDKMDVTFEPINSLEFDKVLSLYKLFINCVSKLKKYPTLSEYVKYVSKKKKFHGDLVTLFPSNFYFDIKDVYERYQKLVKKVEVREFRKVSKSHVKRIERVKADKRVEFGSYIEICEFIFSEEFKVKPTKLS